MSGAEREVISEVADLLVVRSSPTKSLLDAPVLPTLQNEVEEVFDAGMSEADDDFEGFAAFVSSFPRAQPALTAQLVSVSEPASTVYALPIEDAALLEEMLLAKPLPPKRRAVGTPKAQAQPKAKAKAEAKPKAQAMPKGQAKPKAKARAMKMSRHNVYSRAYHGAFAKSGCKATARAAAQAAVAEL
jgi:hypothetical protein